MQSPFFIVGPTAVGKTAIAVAVAERCGAEIVNADAFQLYAGLDLLTAKPSLADRRRVPHHLIGTVPLSENYNVARYQQDARTCLDDAAGRGRPVLVVGGSGMYVKALTHGLSPLPPAQPSLRAELGALPPDELLARLRMLDPVTAAAIDTRNPRRVMRAVEVCLTTGRPFSDFREAWATPAASAGPAGVCLVRDKPELAARIKRRVAEIFSQDVLDEVRAVRPELVGETASRMIGWREAQAHLSGMIDRKCCMEQIETATRRYAKRQMTWFRGESIFEPLSLSEHEKSDAVIDAICRRLTDPDS